ncbi:MAG: chemotaxis protein CheW, partial [Candidatus Binatia bacterium]
VCGLTQGHGEAIAVFRLTNLLGLGQVECAGKASQMLIFGEDRVEFGAIVDEVRAFMTLNNDEILTSSESTTDVTPAYVAGMTEGGLIVLNGATLLEDKGLWVNQTDALRR